VPQPPVPGLDEVLDMFFGTRSAWWRPDLNYCANVIRGRHRAAAVLAAAKPIVEGTWILEELARIVAMRPGVSIATTARPST
jgi:hypothetical protein